MKLFNRKPKDKIKVATALTLKGLTKQVIQLEQKGLLNKEKSKVICLKELI